MLRWFRELLHGEEPAVFPSRYPVEVAVHRLREATSRTVLETLFRQGAVGIVSSGNVALRRHRPFFHNDFSVQFMGTFITEDSKVSLRGGFRLGRFVSLFMTVWLGFAALWTVLAIFFTLVDPANWPLPFAGGGMFAIGTFFV